VDATGVVLADGATDPHYKLTLNADDPAVTEPMVQDSTVFPISDGTWVFNTDRSKWIGPRFNTVEAAGGDYTYELTFDLTGFDPATAVLLGGWATDNLGTDLKLNGTSTSLQNGNQFSSLTSFTVSSGFQTGVNKLEFLVNNAGLLHNGFFAEIELRKHEALLAVNIVALTALAHLFARDMESRGRGHILNVASTAAWIGIPQQNVYAASKAYVLAFSLALSDELRAKKSGVRVTAVCPSYTRTRMLDNPEQGPKLSIPDALVLDAAVVAREGVDACLRGKPMVIPGLSNRFVMSLVQALPKLWVTRVFGTLYRRAQA